MSYFLLYYIFSVANCKIPNYNAGINQIDTERGIHDGAAGYPLYQDNCRGTKFYIGGSKALCEPAYVEHVRTKAGEGTKYQAFY